jgi:hypothetical protein
MRNEDLPVALAQCANFKVKVSRHWITAGAHVASFARLSQDGSPTRHQSYVKFAGVLLTVGFRVVLVQELDVSDEQPVNKIQR